MFDNDIVLKKIYALYKFLFFIITFLFFAHIKDLHSAPANIVFFVYFLTVALFWQIDNELFELFSLVLDIIFAYFVAKLLFVEELIMFSIAPLFASCLLFSYRLSWILLFSSFFVVLFFSDVNVIFAVISYIAAFVSSYLLRESIKNKKMIKQKEAFDREFEDKIAIAKRMSLEFAHEIRNPLMGISGAVEMLKNAKSEQVKNDMINIAQQEIERANNLTKDFLNLEKPYKLNKTAVDVCSFLNDFARKKQGIITITINCKNSATINADRAMFERLFDNLIRNSQEAKASKVSIDVFQDGMYTVIVVKDNGVGIDLDKIDGKQVFMPFYTTKDQGSGLGLAICKQIVELHNGFIEINDTHSFKITIGD